MSYNEYHFISTKTDVSELLKIGEGSQSVVLDISNVVIKTMSVKEAPSIEVFTILSSIDEKDDDLKCLKPIKVSGSDDNMEIWFIKSIKSNRGIPDVWRSIDKLHQLNLAYWDGHPNNFVNFRPVDFGLITMIDKKPIKVRNELPDYCKVNGVLADYWFLNKYFDMQIRQVSHDMKEGSLVLNGIVFDSIQLRKLKYKVFISHKSELKNIFVFDLYNICNKLGYTCFLDTFCLPKIVGLEKLPKTHEFGVKTMIDKAIEQAQIYLLVRSSTDSIWVKREMLDCLMRLEDDDSKIAIIVNYGDGVLDEFNIIDEIKPRVIVVHLKERKRESDSDENKYLADVVRALIDHK